LDTGAAMSCVGYPQARALCNLTGVPYKLSAGTQRFKFGDVVAEPYGMLTTSEDSGRNRTFFSSYRATERASSYWCRHVRCATVVYQERH
jgi:hypothetical protein